MSAKMRRVMKSVDLLAWKMEYIAGVFVRKEARSKGTGKALLDYVKEIKRELTLHLYVKNERAVRFYQREGFQILKKMTDDATGEEEYLMG